jgi:hypothetical protein
MFVGLTALLTHEYLPGSKGSLGYTRARKLLTLRLASHAIKRILGKVPFDLHNCKYSNGFALVSKEGFKPGLCD